MLLLLLHLSDGHRGIGWAPGDLIIIIDSKDSLTFFLFCIS